MTAEKNSESAVPGIASPIVRFTLDTKVPDPFRTVTRPRRFNSTMLRTALGRETLHYLRKTRKRAGT